jgi:hypothetical protein
MPCRILLDYIQKAHISGKKRAEIHTGLIANGWTDLEADEAWEYFERQRILNSLGPTIRKTSRIIFLLKTFSLLLFATFLLIVLFFLIKLA